MNKLLFSLVLAIPCLVSAQDSSGRKTGDTVRLFRSMDTVSIQARRHVIEVRGGKMILNVGQSAAATGGTVLDILQHAPNITLDPNENLLLKGSAAVNVLIDGRLTYLSGQQLSNLLKTLSVESVSRIEIITAPGAQYDAAGNTGIINIITHKSNRQGYAAALTAGGGFGHFGGQTTENLSGNIRSQHINVYTDLGYSKRSLLPYRTNYQRSSFNGQPAVYDRALTNPFHTGSYSYKLGVDWTLNDRQTLGILYAGYYNPWKRNVNGPTTIRDTAGKILSILQNRDFQNEPSTSNAYNLDCSFHLDTAGRVLTADADYISQHNQYDGYVGNAPENAQGQPQGAFQQLNIHQPSYIDIRSIKADLTWPVHAWKIRTGAKFSAVRIDNNFRYDSVAGGLSYFDSSLSDRFIYTEKIAAGYASVSRQWKGLSVEAGLRAEHTVSEGNALNTAQDNKRRYLDWFPSLSLEKQAGKQHRLSLTVSRRINRPPYGDLNPVRYISDPYSYYQGNPNLLPELAWVGVIGYTLKSKYVFSFTYTRQNHLIAETAFINDTSGALVVTNANYPHSDRFELLTVIPVEPVDGWSINLASNFNYTEYPLILATDSQQVRRAAVDLTLSQQVRLSSKSSFELISRYLSPHTGGIYLSGHYFSVDGGYKISFRQGKMEGRLGFTDLFHTIRYSGSSLSHTLQSGYYNTPDTRRISVSLTWRLGGQLTQGKARTLDEQRRL
ncbi:MAG TPA: outer membrane beta-barrel protein [Puia sp.]|uniref:outer membrane beta-barrel protein n=1 Tax=Puia sp. TaxID=2045100 RepID=UPI002C9650DF|nr:outer membrane beta-barrel protein [Puia sp.]HVU94702.1 outer membrane beta-barrel protein [Puia sp.]